MLSERSRAGPVLATALLACTTAGAAHGAEEVHHVGAVDDELFVAVAAAQDPANPDRRAVVAYLCDSASIWSTHAGIVEGDTVSFSDANIDLILDFSGDGVSGSVAHAQGAAESFETHTASGDEGLYLPEDSFDEDGRYAHYVGGWIILSALPSDQQDAIDFDQRGAVAFDLARGGGSGKANLAEGGEWLFPELDPDTLSAQTEFGRVTAVASLNLGDCFTDGGQCPID